jgi:hypothetical protein
VSTPATIRDKFDSSAHDPGNHGKLTQVAERGHEGSAGPSKVMETASRPRLVTSQSPDWLLQTAQQIQLIDYELHAAIRDITKGEMQPDHIPAFMDACVKRDRLMARITRHLARQLKQSPNQAVAAPHIKS